MNVPLRYDTITKKIPTRSLSPRSRSLFDAKSLFFLPTSSFRVTLLSTIHSASDLSTIAGLLCTARFHSVGFPSSLLFFSSHLSCTTPRYTAIIPRPIFYPPHQKAIIHKHTLPANPCSGVWFMCLLRTLISTTFHFIYIAYDVGPNTFLTIYLHLLPALLVSRLICYSVEEHIGRTYHEPNARASQSIIRPSTFTNTILRHRGTQKVS